MTFIPTNQVHGTGFPGEHLTGTLDFWTVNTTVNILNDTSGNPLSNNQRALDALIQTFSMNTQPVIMGAVTTSTISSDATFGSYDMGGAVLVADVYQGVVTGVEILQPGTGFTAVPTVSAVSGGGTGATMTVQLAVQTAVVVSGGTGYSVGNVLTVSGGSGVISAATLTVTAVSSGVVTAVSVSNGGLYATTIPSNPVSTTGGAGTATFTLTWGVGAVVVSAGGSGYTAPAIISFTTGSVSGSIPLYTIRFVNEHDTAWTPYNNANSVTLDTAILGVYNVGFVNSSVSASKNITFTASGTQYSSAYPGSANLGLVNGSTSF